MALDLLTPNSVPTTTQRGPVERWLSNLRSRRIAPHVRGKRVLDFGCGAGLWNLRRIVAMASTASGVDLVFASRPPFRTEEGIQVYPSLESIPDGAFETITALACFEHIETVDLPVILRSLARITTKEGKIVGTFPSPSAQPVLEFLAYKLRIIDETQIRDHRVYYHPNQFAEVVASGGWKLVAVSHFQFGFNTFFELAKMS